MDDRNLMPPPPLPPPRRPLRRLLPRPTGQPQPHQHRQLPLQPTLPPPQPLPPLSQPPLPPPPVPWPQRANSREDTEIFYLEAALVIEMYLSTLVHSTTLHPAVHQLLAEDAYVYAKVAVDLFNEGLSL